MLIPLWALCRLPRNRTAQDAAIAYALDHLEERTWAVVAVNEATTGRADYTIRMNFTVVPNTNTVVDVIAIGLDPRCDSRLLPATSLLSVGPSHGTTCVSVSVRSRSLRTAPVLEQHVLLFQQNS